MACKAILSLLSILPKMGIRFRGYSVQWTDYDDVSYRGPADLDELPGDLGETTSAGIGHRKENWGMRMSFQCLVVAHRRLCRRAAEFLAFRIEEVRTAIFKQNCALQTQGMWCATKALKQTMRYNQFSLSM